MGSSPAPLSCGRPRVFFVSSSPRRPLSMPRLLVRILCILQLLRVSYAAIHKSTRVTRKTNTALQRKREQLSALCFSRGDSRTTKPSLYSNFFYSLRYILLRSACKKLCVKARESPVTRILYIYTLQKKALAVVRLSHKKTEPRSNVPPPPITSGEEVVSSCRAVKGRT